MANVNNIGIIELSSLHKGFFVQDAILKSARVEKIIARSICSGKYIIIVRGEISDLESCLETAREAGEYSIVNALMISNVDEKIFPAIAGDTLLESSDVDGLAVIETFSVAAAVKAADYAVQEAEVDLIRIHIAMAIGGKGMVVLTGDIDSLKSAIVPAVEYLKEDGMLAGYSLITNPHKSVLNDLL